jgi:organic radical activating enzyme
LGEKILGKRLFQYCLHASERVIEKIRKLIGFMPRLSYLEFHLTDHCNLNCKGCGHFAPIAEKKFADLDEFKRDMEQLRKLFSTVQKIVLMGGEPLLHPQIEAFLFATRSFFPKANIIIYTNGILLPQMSETFWNACRTCSVDIDITVYPPVKQKESALIQLVKSKGLGVFTHSVTLFYAFYNKKGDTCANKAFKKCHKRWYNPMLREGKMFVCHKPATIRYFNERYNLKIPTDGFVDIYTHGLSGWDVKEQLDIAPTTCCYCTLGWDVIPVFPWKPSRLVMQDWDPLAIQA